MKRIAISLQQQGNSVVLLVFVSIVSQKENQSALQLSFAFINIQIQKKRGEMIKKLLNKGKCNMQKYILYIAHVVLL